MISLLYTPRVPSATLQCPTPVSLSLRLLPTCLGTLLRCLVSCLCQLQLWPILCQFIQGCWSQSKSGRGLGLVWGRFRERHPELSDQSAQHPPRSLHSALQGKVSMLQKACFAFYEPLIRAAMWLAEFLEVNRRDITEWSQLRWR